MDSTAFKGVLLRWVVNAAALMLVSYTIRGIEIEGIAPAFVAAAVLGVINAILRPILLILTLPINILTLGLFTFVINGMMLSLTAKIVKGFFVTGFWSALFGALVLSVVSSVITLMVRDEREGSKGAIE